MINSSTFLQSHIYFKGIDGYSFRVMTELWLYIYVVFSIPGVYICQKYFRSGLIVCYILTSICSVHNFTVKGNYWWRILGNVIGSFGQCCIFCAPATIAGYFPKKLESLILTLPMFFNMLGDGFGLWFPIYMMDDSLDGVVIDQKMDTINIIAMIATVPSMLLLLPFVTSGVKPRAADNGFEIEEKLEKIDRSLGIFQSFEICFKDKMSMFNLFAASISNGIFYMLMTISNTAMVDFGYSDGFTGAIGFIYVIAGTLIGSLIVQIFDKQIDSGIKMSSMANFFGFTIFLIIKLVYQGCHENNDTWFTICIIFYY